MTGSDDEMKRIVQWVPVAEYRLKSIEDQQQRNTERMSRIESDIDHVDKRVASVDIKVSRIEGGISFLKWSIPVSITLAMGIGGVISWLN